MPQAIHGWPGSATDPEHIVICQVIIKNAFNTGRSDDERMLEKPAPIYNRSAALSPQHYACAQKTRPNLIKPKLRLLVRIMQTRQLPTYLSRWTASPTASRTMSFCFDNRTGPPQPFNFGHPQ